VTKWDDWERIHAEQDARDRKIVIGAFLAILLLIVLLASGGFTSITG
jgi:hypothetical protein